MTLYDHSAPWACGLDGCKRCAAKPSWGEWWVAVQSRQAPPRVRRVRWLPECCHDWCNDKARYAVAEYRGGPSRYWCERHRPIGSLPRAWELRLRHGRR